MKNKTAINGLFIAVLLAASVNACVIPFTQSNGMDIGLWDRVYNKTSCTSTGGNISCCMNNDPTVGEQTFIWGDGLNTVLAKGFDITAHVSYGLLTSSYQYEYFGVSNETGPRIISGAIPSMLAGFTGTSISGVSFQCVDGYVHTHMAALGQRVALRLVHSQNSQLIDGYIDNGTGSRYAGNCTISSTVFNKLLYPFAGNVDITSSNSGSGRCVSVYDYTGVSNYSVIASYIVRDTTEATKANCTIDTEGTSTPSILTTNSGGQTNYTILEPRCEDNYYVMLFGRATCPAGQVGLISVLDEANIVDNSANLIIVTNGSDASLVCGYVFQVSYINGTKTSDATVQLWDTNGNNYLIYNNRGLGTYENSALPCGLSYIAGVYQIPGYTQTNYTLGRLDRADDNVALTLANNDGFQSVGSIINISNHGTIAASSIVGYAYECNFAEQCPYDSTASEIQQNCGPPIRTFTFNSAYIANISNRITYGNYLCVFASNTSGISDAKNAQIIQSTSESDFILDFKQASAPINTLQLTCFDIKEAADPFDPISGANILAVYNGRTVWNNISSSIVCFNVTYEVGKMIAITASKNGYKTQSDIPYEVGGEWLIALKREASNINLSQYYNVTGAVFYDEAPKSGISVSLKCESGTKSQRTNSTGYYYLTGARPGETCTLSAGDQTKKITVTYNNFVPTPFKFVTGSSPGGGSNSTEVTISVIHSVTGLGLANAHVTIIYGSDSIPMQTDPNGEVTFQGLKIDARYYVSVSLTGFESGSSSFVAGGAAPNPVYMVPLQGDKCAVTGDIVEVDEAANTRTPGQGKIWISSYTGSIIKEINDVNVATFQVDCKGDYILCANYQTQKTCKNVNSGASEEGGTSVDLEFSFNRIQTANNITKFITFLNYMSIFVFIIAVMVAVLLVVMLWRAIWYGDK